MDISHLHIFQKDTDATAPLRGYQYQVLKTLETWISNLLEDNQEEIYCEFEEDIFQKSEVERKVKFRQIKLYSSNFSFHSDEIKKCLVKFFLLHLKSDHRNYKKQFVFETNSKIASKYKGNDANLLRTWVKNQENLSGKLLKDCIDKVKSIVSEHFNSKAELLAKSLGEESVNKALLAFSELTNDDWKEFVKLIGWQFASVPPEEEFVYTRNRIKGLLLRVPFPVNEKNVDAVYGILFKEVSLRSSEEKPVNRKLTHENLLLHLISAGTEEDKWYAEVFDKYSVALKKEFIRIGEIIEILDASRYCRKSQCLIEEHHQFWLKVLDDLIINTDIHGIIYA